MRGSVPPDETTDAPVSRRASSRRPRRRPASPCVYDAGDGDRDGGARRGDRQRRPADDRARTGDNPRRLGLDRQRLSARRHCFAASPGGARRQPRLSPRLLAWPRHLHRGFSCLRLGANSVRADARTRDPGIRRGGNHERQYRARPIHLSVVTAWPGRRQYRAGRGGVLGRRPERRGGDSLRRLVAMALPRQRSNRRGRARHGGANPGVGVDVDRAPTALALTEYLLLSNSTRQVFDTEAGNAWNPSAIGNELWPLVLEHVPDRSPALLGMGFACRNTRAASVRSKGPTGWGRGTSLSGGILPLRGDHW